MPTDIRKIKKLIELLESSGIAEIEIKEGEDSVRISRHPQGGVAMAMPSQPLWAAPYGFAPAMPSPAPVAAPAAPEAEAEVAAAAAKGVRIVSNMIAVMRQPEHLACLAGLVADGKVHPASTAVLPLAEAAEAHRRIQMNALH